MISRRLTAEVQAALFGRGDGITPSEIALRMEGEDFEADQARDWVDAMIAPQPPCSPQWSADELAVVRADLGYVCHELTGCAEQP